MAQLCLLVVSFLTLIIPHFFISGVLSSGTFTLVNKCDYTVWRGIVSNTGSIAQLSTTGFALKQKEYRTITPPSSSVGRLWGRTHCTGNFSCLTGDCSSKEIECAGSDFVSPVTLVWFQHDNNGHDYYYLSVAYGYNLPMLIAPQQGTGFYCSNAGCILDLNEACPSELKMMSTGGEEVVCNSACNAFGDDQYCCSGAYITPSTCKPSNYSELFKKACPRAQSYVFERTNFYGAGEDYQITFCPTAT